MRILIIDDEPAIPMALKDFLEDTEEYEVYLANTGEQGIEIIEESDIDVCIVDMRLPKMTGNEFIIKASSIAPQAKYIIHTGSLDYKVPEELREIGITSKSIVFKPAIDMNLFTDRINQLMK
ncbi:MAG: response regulator [Desulfovibrio sp.]